MFQICNNKSQKSVKRDEEIRRRASGLPLWWEAQDAQAAPSVALSQVQSQAWTRAARPPHIPLQVPLPTHLLRLGEACDAWGDVWLPVSRDQRKQRCWWSLQVLGVRRWDLAQRLGSRVQGARCCCCHGRQAEARVWSYPCHSPYLRLCLHARLLLRLARCLRFIESILRDSNEASCWVDREL